MLNKDILYLKKSNRATLLYFKNNKVEEVPYTLEKLLDNYCYQDLTTYEGRIEAIKKVYHISKHVPIYLSENIVLIQSKNKKELDNIYINSYNILDMIEDNNKTQITFSDNSVILLNVKYHLLKKYYDLSLKIKKQHSVY